MIGKYDIDILIAKDNIHIDNSYRVRKRKDMKLILHYLRDNYTSWVLDYRSDNSLVHEWVGHNNLYVLGLFRSHTKDVDLEYPEEWYYKVIWWLLSRIVL